MSNAVEIIRDMLNEVGINNQYDEKEIEVKTNINNCGIRIRKHKYTGGYSTAVRCNIETNTTIDHSASFIDNFMVMKDKDRFYLYGISNESALNAGKFEIKIPVKKTPIDTGTFYIKCSKEFNYDCKVERRYKDI